MEDDPRAELYSSLSSVTSGTVEEVLTKLSTIDRSRLSANDQQLLDAASAIVTEITVPPAGLKSAETKPVPPAVRTVGPEPAVTAAPPPESEAGPLPAKVAEAPAQSRSRSPSTVVDVTVERAQALVATTRVKLADIDKLIGDMPE